MTEKLWASQQLQGNVQLRRWASDVQLKCANTPTQTEVLTHIIKGVSADFTKKWMLELCSRKCNSTINHIAATTWGNHKGWLNLKQIMDTSSFSGRGCQRTQTVIFHRITTPVSSILSSHSAARLQICCDPSETNTGGNCWRTPGPGVRLCDMWLWQIYS